MNSPSSNSKFSGSAKSRKNGRRLAASMSVSMDGSVKDYEVLEDVGPHDEIFEPQIDRSYDTARPVVSKSCFQNVDGTTTTTIKLNKERPSSYHKRNQTRKSRNGDGASAACVAMDGQIRSFDGSCSTQPSTVVGRGDSSSGSGDRTSRTDSDNQTSFVAADARDVLVVVNGDDASFSSKDKSSITPSTLSSTSSWKKTGNGKRNWKWCILATLVVVVASIALIVLYTAGNGAKNRSTNNVQTVSSNANAPNTGSCSPGGIKDTMEPQLELYVTGLSRLMNDTEIDEVQRLILVEYNTLSGGCDDEFQRWMYSVKIVNQTLTHQVNLDGNSEGFDIIENDLKDAFTLVALFGTRVSCDGCTEDSAFATEFPTSFGNATLITDSDRRRRLSLDGSSSSISSSAAARGAAPSDSVTALSTGVRVKSVPSVDEGGKDRRRTTMMTLDAGQIMKAIENAVVTRIPDIQAIVEVKVFSVKGGEITTTRKIDRGG